MSTDKVFRWILFITAAAIVFTVATVISRPDTADSSVESRLGSFLNLPESTPEPSATPSPGLAAEIVSPTPGAEDSTEPTPPMEMPTEEPTPEPTPTNEPTPTEAPTATPEPTQTAEATPEATEAPEPTTQPSPEPTLSPEPTPATPTPDQGNSGAPASPGQPASTVKPAGTYTVKEGDTYGCIAERYYGSYEYWPAVIAVNQGFGFEERRLFVGAVVQLPEINVTKPATSLCS